MGRFAGVTVAALLAGTAWSGAAAQQPGPQPASPTAVQQAAAPDPAAPDPAADRADQATAGPRADDAAADVIVTGTRTPRAVDKIPGAITVISPAEVQRSLTLTEDSTAVLARTVPGYSESNQTLNTLGETMRGRAALYLFDGIPQSTPLRDGSRNATFTDMSVVQRIEVIGGASAAEGIGAAGGIINYISKRATESGTRIGANARIGSQFEDDSQVYKIGGYVAHKQADLDLYLNAAMVDRGITYDARGRRIGISASSSLADTRQYNVFAKVASDFAPDQRLEAVASFFRIASKDDYFYVAGSRAAGIPDTAAPGRTLGTGGVPLDGAQFNRFLQFAVNYSHADLLGGSLLATVYGASQRMRFPPDNSVDRQDPLIAPLGTLVDQSEIGSRKYGLRTAWTRPDFLIDGFEVRIGVDLVHDTTRQSLALTDRVWVPPLKYDSVGPYAQLTYDIGPLTATGGWRREDGRVRVDDYTTTFFRNRAFVRGGELDYANDLFNGGAILRLGDGLSVFGSYGEGFTLPNVGIPLRNINYPGQSVEGILDLQAVVFRNREFGANWRGSWGSLGTSFYWSRSDLGSTLAVDPVTRDFVLNRRPVRIRGIDFTSEFRPTDTIRLNFLYSRVVGTTTAANGLTGPFSVTLGTVNISPDKINGQAEWRFSPEGAVSVAATRIVNRSINEGTALAERTRGYTLFDATASYRVEEIGTFALGIENLANRFYFLASSQVDIFQNYFAGRGRTVSLSLRRDF